MSEREEKFTPGEWKGDEQGLIWANGDVIAQVYDNPDTGNDPIGEEESDFNAALICAAPDLYAACKIAVEIIDGLAHQQAMEDDFYVPGLQKIKAALTKAKGQP